MNLNNRYIHIFIVEITIITIFLIKITLSNNQIKEQRYINKNIEKKISFYKHELNLFSKKQNNNKKIIKERKNTPKIRRKNELPEILKIISELKTDSEFLKVNSISEIKNDKTKIIDSKINIKTDVQNILIDLYTDYETTIKLLKKIKDYPYLITVNKIQINKEKYDKNTANLNIKIDILIYKNRD